ncbi:early endosome antigen 1-like [Dromiciops gliroides]|uniref:early endosome antigen 1-like n=1 Tax=Dromiciops gliroides TaxID=33562 RepID=UPI001CC387BD|nr:early endosome antigen 1-like [Dromiciops gliroides]
MGGEGGRTPRPISSDWSLEPAPPPKEGPDGLSRLPLHARGREVAPPPPLSVAARLRAPSSKAGRVRGRGGCPSGRRPPAPAPAPAPSSTMLRRILQRTPGRVGSQGSDSDSSATPGNALDVNNEGSSEGFICPQCMKSHGSAEELFKHYQAVHDSGNESSSWRRSSKTRRCDTTPTRGPRPTGFSEGRKMVLRRVKKELENYKGSGSK